MDGVFGGTTLACDRKGVAIERLLLCFVQTSNFIDISRPEGPFLCMTLPGVSFRHEFVSTLVGSREYFYMKVGAGSMEQMAAAKRVNWTANVSGGAAEAESREADWVLAARSGDRAAFAQLVRQHESTVLRVAYRLLMDAHDAQDAAQDVFVRLYDHLDRFDAGRPLTPWLYRITVNVCRTHARKRSRRTAAEQASILEADQSRSTQSVTEAADWLERGLSRLSPRERAALVLRDLEGLTATEAARAMRCAPVTVRTLAARARLKLKQLYDAEQRGLDK